MAHFDATQCVYIETGIRSFLIDELQFFNTCSRLFALTFYGDVFK